MERIIDYKLPPVAVTIVIVCLAIATACLGIWLAANALMKLVRQIRKTLAAELRLQHIRLQYDREALNYWIRDSFRHKKQAERERRRADQEQYDKRQIAMGAENYMRRCGT